MAKKVTKVTMEAQRICKELGVEKLFYNTKGEYFTEYSYAVASEGGDKKKVATYTCSTAEEEQEAVKEVEVPVKTEKKVAKAEPAPKTVTAGKETEKAEGNE